MKFITRTPTITLQVSFVDRGHDDSLDFLDCLGRGEKLKSAKDNKANGDRNGAPKRGKYGKTIFQYFSGKKEQKKNILKIVAALYECCNFFPLPLLGSVFFFISFWLRICYCFEVCWQTDWWFVKWYFLLLLLWP